MTGNTWSSNESTRPYTMKSSFWDPYFPFFIAELYCIQNRGFIDTCVVYKRLNLRLAFYFTDKLAWKYYYDVCVEEAKACDGG